MLEGSLSDFHLADVLRLIGAGQKTGVLEIEQKKTQGWIFFRQGAVSGATSTLHEEPLVGVMVRNGCLEEKDLEGVLAAHQEKPGDGSSTIGSLLVERGLVTHDTMETFFKERIYEVLLHLRAWDTGSFKFIAMEIPHDCEIGLTADVPEIVAEGNKRRVAWEAMQTKISSMGAVFKKSLTMAANSEIDIKAGEWQVLSLIDGHNEVSKIISLAGLGEFGTLQVLFSLLEAGLIEEAVVERTPEKPTRERKTGKITKSEEESPEKQSSMKPQAEPVAVDTADESEKAESKPASDAPEPVAGPSSAAETEQVSVESSEAEEPQKQTSATAKAVAEDKSATAEAATKDKSAKAETVAEDKSSTVEAAAKDKSATAKAVEEDKSATVEAVTEDKSGGAKAVEEDKRAKAKAVAEDKSAAAEAVTEDESSSKGAAVSGRHLLEELTVLTGRRRVKKQKGKTKKAGPGEETGSSRITEEVILQIKKRIEEL